MTTHSVTATTLKEELNKFGQKSDEIISAIPFSLYFLLCLVAVGAVGQATYDYYHQEPYNNFTIDTSFLNNPNYISTGGIMENIKIPIYQGPVRPSDDEEYFRLTGITKSKGDNN